MSSLSRKLRDNFAALDLYAELKEQDRSPTDPEKEVLSRFCGWGAFGQPFHDNMRRFDYYIESGKDIPGYATDGMSETELTHLSVRRELRARMTEEEFDAAKVSTLNAHYTSAPVVKAMWAAVKRLGFTGGKVLEPAVGTGNFLGLMPEGLRDQTTRTAIELEPVTAQIAKWLYPETRVFNAGFQDTPLSNDSFDLAISNVPFGKYQVADRELIRSKRGWLGSRIHNYYFAKALDKVRPGGVVAFITSHHTMDAVSHKRFRDYLSKHGCFVGAIRLPRNAFAGNAGTSVTTDIVFIQKRDPEFEAKHPRDEHGKFCAKWSDSVETSMKSRHGEYQDTGQLNEYYVQHPEMMLGDMGVGYGQHSAKETGLDAREGEDLEGALQAAISRLPADIWTPRENIQEDAAAQQDREAANGVKHLAYVVEDGQLFRNHDGVLKPETASAPDLARVEGMCLLRNAALDLISAERSDVDDHALDPLRAELNQQYDRFVQQHGAVHDKANVRAFRGDPDFGLVMALEHVSAQTKEVDGETVEMEPGEAAISGAQKADIFHKRVIAPSRTIESAATPEDALGIVLNECGGLDWRRMSGLLGDDPDSIADHLHQAGLIYRNPARLDDPKCGGWETADQYLSGQVRQKLQDARVAAQTDAAFQVNCEALEAVQPRDLLPSEITTRLGMNWIPDSVVNKFIAHMLGTSEERLLPGRRNSWRNDKKQDPQIVRYTPATGKWSFEAIAEDIADRTQNRATWGTEAMSFLDLLRHCLSGQDATVKKPEIGEEKSEKPKMVVDEVATAAARAMQDKIQKEFGEWVWGDADRSADLVQRYNETFNDQRLREFNGHHLTMPGLSAELAAEGVRPHIKDAVWRGIQDGRALWDHCTGAGKTRVCSMTAMELRRLGLARKPMITVPNSAMAQWDREFRLYYPGSKVLTVWEEDWKPERRQELLDKIATGDWDAVICTHEAFAKIPLSSETRKDFIREKIEDYEAALAMRQENENNEKGDRTSKQLTTQIENLRGKLEAADMEAETRQDNSLTFEQLGVDALLVDEFHAYKNLAFPTLLEGVGLGKGDAKRAEDMFQKSQWLLRKNNNRGLYCATATPISNSLVEMYVMMKYLVSDRLKEKGCQHFDDWAKNFTKFETRLEPTHIGGYKMRTRLSDYVNIPEAVGMYAHVADMKSAADLKEYLPVPELKGGGPILHVAEFDPALQAHLDDWAWRAKEINRMGPKKAHEILGDGHLNLINESNQASIALRLLDPNTPDLHDSKINQCCGEVARLYREGHEHRSTQVVFSDIGVAGGATEKSKRPDDPDRMDYGSIYAELKRKMVAQGIPAHEIAFAQEFDSSEKRAKMQADMNSGKIRVLLATTEKGGTGLNMQERMRAIHHLDAQYKPSSVEQRNGRLLRQGNLHREWGIPVEIHHYIAEGTFDEFKWEQCKHKWGFMDQIRRGKMMDRTARATDDELTYDAAAFQAQAARDPRFMQKAAMENRVQTLGLLRSGHRDRIYQAQQHVAAAPARISGLRDTAGRMEAASKRWAASQPDPFVMKVGIHEFGDKEQAGAALLSMFDGTVGETMDTRGYVPIGQYGGFWLEGRRQNRGSGWREVKIVSPGRDLEGFIRADGDSGKGMIQRLDNYFKGLPDSARHNRERADQIAAEVKDHQAIADQPFEHELEYNRLNRELATLTATLAKEYEAEDKKLDTNREPPGGWQESDKVPRPEPDDEPDDQVDDEPNYRSEPIGKSIAFLRKQAAAV